MNQHSLSTNSNLRISLTGRTKLFSPYDKHLVNLNAVLLNFRPQRKIIHFSILLQKKPMVQLLSNKILYINPNKKKCCSSKIRMNYFRIMTALKINLKTRKIANLSALNNHQFSVLIVTLIIKIS